MAITFKRAEDFDYPHANKTIKDDWMGCPPPSVVSFVRTLVGLNLLSKHQLILFGI